MEARAHGDDERAAARRADAGHALIAERFGQTPDARRPDTLNLEAIRAEAAAEAPRLWARMAEL